MSIYTYMLQNVFMNIKANFHFSFSSKKFSYHFVTMLLSKACKKIDNKLLCGGYIHRILKVNNVDHDDELEVEPKPAIHIESLIYKYLCGNQLKEKQIINVSGIKQLTPTVSLKIVKTVIIENWDTDKICLLISGPGTNFFEEKICWFFFEMYPETGNVDLFDFRSDKPLMKKIFVTKYDKALLPDYLKLKERKSFRLKFTLWLNQLRHSLEIKLMGFGCQSLGIIDFEIDGLWMRESIFSIRTWNGKISQSYFISEITDEYVKNNFDYFV